MGRSKLSCIIVAPVSSNISAGPAVTAQRITQIQSLNAIADVVKLNTFDLDSPYAFLAAPWSASAFVVIKSLTATYADECAHRRAADLQTAVSVASLAMLTNSVILRYLILWFNARSFVHIAPRWRCGSFGQTGLVRASPTTRRDAARSRAFTS